MYRRERITLLAASAAFMWTGCSVERSGLSPSDSSIDPPVLDAGFDAPDSDSVTDATPPDVGTDAVVPPPDVGADSGPPPHCSNETLDGDESAVDCGGSCAPCACGPCRTAADCASGECSDGSCLAHLETVLDEEGNPISAFVRDGSILLARYPAFMPNPHPYDPSRHFSVTRSTLPMNWAPDTCNEAGHLPFTRFAVAGRSIVVECGRDGSSEVHRYETTLFDSFRYGAFGDVGAEGTPGWAALGSGGIGARYQHGMCGAASIGSGGGFALCDGPGGGTSFSNHLASITAYENTARFACAGEGCSGGTCDVWMNIWLE